MVDLDRETYLVVGYLLLLKKSGDEVVIELRKAEWSNLDDVMIIIAEARAFLGSLGLDQWQDDYPAQSDIENDMDAEQGYVLLVDNRVAGYCALIVGEEPAYTAITAGSWLNDSIDYVTIHRLALSDRYRGQGLAHVLWEKIFEMMQTRGYADFRVDTHSENKIMRHLVVHEGFVQCGIVHFDNERVRVAYQKIIDD